MKLDIEKYLDPKNIYGDIWKKAEKKTPLPKYVKNFDSYDFKEFKEKAYSNSSEFAEKLVNSLIEGNAIILKNAFDQSFLSKIKKDLAAVKKCTKSEFYKTIDKIPNYYRQIDSETSKKYSFPIVKDTFYFFPWNEDKFSLYSEAYKRWQVLKYISGYYKNAWEKNIPKDGIIDRIQVVKYPPDKGLAVLHQDPYLFQKFFISVYMSKKDKDYVNGGMYFINKNREKIDFEHKVDVGDIAFGLATLYHGVDIHQLPSNVENSEISGRWFMGLYSLQTDIYNDRHTAKAVKNL